MTANDTIEEPVRRSRPIVWVVGFVAAAVLVILVLPAIQAARRAGSRAESASNIKQIGIAFHNYHDAFGSFPPGGTFRDDGTGLHGWPTLILPFLMANQFGSYIDLNVPWDDPTQIDAYIQHSFRIFRDPGISQHTTTDGIPVVHYAANEWLLHRNSNSRLDEISDQEHTLLLADAFGDFLPIGSPYNWRDPTVPFRTATRQFGNLVNKQTLVLFVDGTEHWWQPDIDATLFAQLAGPKSLRPTPEDVARSVQPYRLKSTDYWRFLIINGQSEPPRKDGYFVKLRLSPDNSKLEAIFNDKNHKSNDELRIWRTKIQPFIKSKDLAHVHIAGSLDAQELQPFLEIPTLKRLSLGEANIHGDKEAVLSKVRSSIQID